MKQCSGHCGLIKDESEFYFRKDNKCYRNECKSCNKKQQEKYRELHKKEKTKYNKKYWKEHPDLNKNRKEYFILYNASEKEKERKRKWNKKNPNILRAKKRRRRAIELFINENYTALDEQYTKELFQNKCFNCGSTKYLCIDHIFPLSMGNPLTKHNACVLCKSCNSHKSDKLSENFYTLEKLIELFILTA